MNWLPLTDYSTKYKVSVSTLRRRIKTDEIHFRFEDGKYLISDEPMETHTRVHRPSQQMHAPVVGSPEVEATMVAAANSSDEPVLTAANQLLVELKKAYSLILQEKEEQILQLKEEVSDLKTLVRVLESENSRLKSF